MADLLNMTPSKHIVLLPRYLLPIYLISNRQIDHVYLGDHLNDSSCLLRTQREAELLELALVKRPKTFSSKPLELITLKWQTAGAGCTKNNWNSVLNTINSTYTLNRSIRIHTSRLGSAHDTSFLVFRTNLYQGKKQYFSFTDRVSVIS